MRHYTELYSDRSFIFCVPERVDLAHIVVRGYEDSEGSCSLGPVEQRNGGPVREFPLLNVFVGVVDHLSEHLGHCLFSRPWSL
jgi:hypothetical protein